MYEIFKENFAVYFHHKFITKIFFIYIFTDILDKAAYTYNNILSFGTKPTATLYYICY